MRRAGLLVAVLVVACTPGRALSQHGPPAAPSQTVPVSIGFGSVTPARVDVITGETVTWTNDSVRRHTITADDGTFDSGHVVSGTSFGRRFAAPGAVAYHCILHPFIRGTVGVHSLLLRAPHHAAAPNRAFPLTGRAALPAATPITIEADQGAGFAPVAATRVQADGSFATSIVPTTTATYRAVTHDAASPAVTLIVLDRRISLTSQRGRHRTLIRTHVAPAAAHASVVLQLFLPEHFGWWPVQRTTLDHASSARFALRLHRRVTARVLLTLPDGATPLATSPTLRLGPQPGRGHRPH